MSLRNASTVSGVAAWPSIDLAKSPGSISVASEMMIETTNSVTTPKPRRFNTVATIAFKASSPVVKPHTNRGTGDPARPWKEPLGEPPALGDFQAISWKVGRDVPVGQRLRRRVHVVIENEDDDAAVVMDQLLHLGIHGRTLLVVGFTAGRHKKLIEARIIPMRLVPGRPLGIDRGHHPVDGRTAVPVTGAPGLLQPDIVKVAIVGLTHHVDLDARRLRMLLVQHGRVDAAVKGGVGGAQIDLQCGEAGLLQVELRLLRVVDILRLWIDRIFDGRSDRIVVSRECVPEKHLLRNVFTVDGPFERSSYVNIVEGRGGHIHREDVVSVAGDLVNRDLRIPLQQGYRLEVGARDPMDLASDQRIVARDDVSDREK